MGRGKTPLLGLGKTRFEQRNDLAMGDDRPWGGHKDES